MNIVLNEMRFKIPLVESQVDEKFRKGKSLSFNIKDDWFNGIVNRVDTSCWPKWVFKWPSDFRYHKVMTCSWGYGYSPWAVEFNFFIFIFVLKIFVKIKHHCNQLWLLVRLGVDWTGWHVEAWRLFGKMGNVKFLLWWQISSFFSLGVSCV